MDVRTLPGLDPSIKNVEYVDFPYNWDMSPRPAEAARKVIFFGNDFRNLPFVDLKEFASITNQCLDYVRAHAAGYELYYKPHPAETDELDMLNLTGFAVLRERNNAEMFLYENRYQIQSVYSVSSWASGAAYTFGIDAHVFLEPFRACMGGLSVDYYREAYFAEMPASFFIDHFDVPPTNNARDLKESGMPRSIEDTIASRGGAIWCVANDISFSASIASFAKAVRMRFPERKLVLVVSSHPRWKLIGAEFVTRRFDETIVLPRVFYSLRPRRLWNIVALARRVRSMPLKKGDVLFGFSNYEFIENSLAAYHSDAHKVSFVMRRDLDTHYTIRDFDIFKRMYFNWTKAGWFYNYVLEPLFGVRRTIFMQNKEENITTLVRYQQPLNALYDDVYVLSTRNTSTSL